MLKQRIDLSRDYGLTPCIFCKVIPKIQEVETGFEINHKCLTTEENSFEVKVTNLSTISAVVLRWNESMKSVLESIQADENNVKVSLAAGYMNKHQKEENDNG